MGVLAGSDLETEAHEEAYMVVHMGRVLHRSDHEEGSRACAGSKGSKEAYEEESKGVHDSEEGTSYDAHREEDHQLGKRVESAVYGDSCRRCDSDGAVARVKFEFVATDTVKHDPQLRNAVYLLLHKVIDCRRCHRCQLDHRGVQR